MENQLATSKRMPAGAGKQYQFGIGACATVQGWIRLKGVALLLLINPFVYKIAES